MHSRAWAGTDGSTDWGEGLLNIFYIQEVSPGCVVTADSSRSITFKHSVEGQTSRVWSTQL